MVFKRLGLGRRTRQFNKKAQGARNLAQWLMAVLTMKGESSQTPVSVAVPEAAMHEATFHNVFGSFRQFPE